ncbi:MAG: diguanylate cyclase [Alteromonadaceae bacterium]|uniref:sensor domain-containing diguanylate cyclase n=1 Tax=Marinobacter sp. V034 TaxID=3459610 RepID=UPI000C6ADDB4|nr:diguanylate cyclase [Alteromonadaceae bacterium]MBH84436.1 diguanylate cyclase [Alteromonadaceae bacterium]|tara:strand:- start:7699 stop:9585 length:1887 start_codon:yes stop_codon:yes gene_type:complete
MNRWWLCVLLLAGIVTNGFADPLVVGPLTQKERLAPHVSYWKAPDTQTELADVLTVPESDWVPNGGDDVNLGYTDDTYWFRMTITNPYASNDNFLIELAYPVLDHVAAYDVVDGEVRKEWLLGDKQSFHDRPVDHRNFLLPLRLDANSSGTLYLKVHTSSSMQLPLVLWRQTAFFSAEQPRLLMEGLYYGIILVMVLYNLFVYLAVGERSFLFYVGYIMAMPLFLTSLHGVAFQYLWPEATWWNDQAIVFFLNLTIAFGGLFAMRFLSVLPATHPRLSRLAIAIIATSVMFSVLSCIAPYHLMIMPTIVLAVLGCSGLMLMSVVRLREKDPAARYYLLAWFCMLLGGIVLALNKFTILPQNVLTENAAQVGSALGVILLSIALAERLNKEKRKAFMAQEQLYRQERKARLVQEKNLQTQQEANTLLEARVQERTRDLESVNEQLLELSSTDALTGLKNRGHFDRTFESACVRAYRFGQPLSLLMVDIDHFKQFNDTFGHLVGDDCLQMVASGISEFVTRPQDLAARYGGEEFVILLPNTPENGAVRVAEKIRQQIENTDFRVSDEVVRLTISIGVRSLIPSHAEAARELFRQADEALYEAKGSGRNRVSVYRGGDRADKVTKLRPVPH